MENSERALLIVEDEPLIASLYKEFMDEYGFKSTVCNNGATALMVYKLAKPSFDLVITDETMPEMTGTELSKALLALTPDLPIILLSGASDVSETIANENVNISHYLKKPISLFTLKDTIEACLADK